jgi:hypothetical protein
LQDGFTLRLPSLCGQKVLGTEMQAIEYTATNYTQGEIWEVQFIPQRGAEIAKI